MKVCPVCQASFAEGFVYCPQDAELLVRYDLRAQLQKSHSRQEPNFLLSTESFLSSLQRVFSAAWEELRSHPRHFLVALLCGESSSKRRQLQLQAGVALALIAYTFVGTGLLLLGLHHSTKAEQLLPRLVEKDDTLAAARLIFPVVAFSKTGTDSRGHLGGSAANAQRTSGGGGGGDQQPQSASGGTLPHATLLPQQALPDPAPPKIPNATLVQVPTIYADPLAVKFVAGQTGAPTAPPAPPARGQGAHGGLGGGDGTGINGGNGAGYHLGSGGNTGGRSFEIGTGAPTGSGRDGNLPRMADLRVRPTILYKEKARYSEEARQQKVQGTVLLVANFNANGTISEIRVVRGLPFGLTEEAISSAKRIRFQPAVENGVAVTVRAQLEYNFALY